MSSKQPEQERLKESPLRDKTANATFQCNYALLSSHVVAQLVSLEIWRGVIFQENRSVGSRTFVHGLLWSSDPDLTEQVKGCSGSGLVHFSTFVMNLPPPNRSSCRQFLGVTKSLPLNGLKLPRFFPLS